MTVLAEMEQSEDKPRSNGEWKKESLQPQEPQIATRVFEAKEINY